MAFLRAVTAQLKGIKKTEAWGIYLTVAFLCLTMACLLAVNAALHPVSKETVIYGQQHIQLRLKEKIVPVDAHAQTETKKAASASVSAQSQPTTAAAPSAPKQEAQVEETVPGVWYYDEVHKDWRYKKARS